MKSKEEETYLSKIGKPWSPEGRGLEPQGLSTSSLKCTLLPGNRVSDINNPFRCMSVIHRTQPSVLFNSSSHHLLYFSVVELWVGFC